jgi:hypothetical protein
VGGEEYGGLALTFGVAGGGADDGEAGPVVVFVLDAFGDELEVGVFGEFFVSDGGGA